MLSFVGSKFLLWFDVLFFGFEEACHSCGVCFNVLGTNPRYNAQIMRIRFRTCLQPMEFRSKSMRSYQHGMCKMLEKQKNNVHDH